MQKRRISGQSESGLRAKGNILNTTSPQLEAAPISHLHKVKFNIMKQIHSDTS